MESPVRVTIASDVETAEVQADTTVAIAHLSVSSATPTAGGTLVLARCYLRLQPLR